MFPVVDVSDTTMAASGTTKRISINNILACSPSATLASATITGALTANGGVNLANATAINFGGLLTIYSDTAAGLFIRGRTTGGTTFQTQDGTNPLLNITNAGVFTFSDGAGGTRMTLNATGLGVGRTPATYKFEVLGNAQVIQSNFTDVALRISQGASTSGNKAQLLFTDSSGTIGNITSYGSGYGSGVSGALAIGTGGTDRLYVDSVGNIGVGVTPSAWGSNFKSIESGAPSAYVIAAANVNGVQVASNCYNDNTNWIYKTTGTAARFAVNTNQFQWFNAPSGTAGNAITFTQAMTLDASGNLLVGTTTNTNSSRVFARGTASSSALALQGATGDVALAQLTVGKFDNNTTTSQVFVRFTINDNSGGSGQINANGASQAAFGSFSDSRLKENIVSIPSQLANILSLRPVEFDYKDGSGHQIGFVAQEIQEVYSDAVGEQNGFLTVTGWSKTEARLVSAIKELAAKVQALEAKLA
jgi:hypothetical protein